MPEYSTYYSGLPLRNACARNDQATVEVLLEFGADPSTPEPGVAPQGGALHSIAGQDNLEVARMLLERGADPNAAVESSGSCMSRARSAEMRKLLASYGGEFQEDQNLANIEPEALEAVYGKALPLRYYVDIADIETLTARIEKDPDVAGEVLQLELRKQSLPNHSLIRLCLDRDPSAARLIHANELIYNINRYGGEDNVLDMVKWLLDAGMTPNDSDWLRVTSLHRLEIGDSPYGSDGSVAKVHVRTMTLFIEAGADLDAKDEEYHSTPLGWAARWGRMGAAELLLERGAKTNLPDDLPWASPLAGCGRRATLKSPSCCPRMAR